MGRKKLRGKLICLVAFAATAFASPGQAEAQQRSTRGTLMQWSYGNSFTGGPDLNEPIVTDRPDFTEASSTVGLGVLQIESGYTYSYDDDGATTTRSHTYPEQLLRYGALADWLEFRFAWTVGNTDVGGLSTSDGEELYAGMKVGLTPQEGILPEMALVPQMTFPVGEDGPSGSEVLPGLNWLYSWAINDFVSTGGSSQFNHAIDGTDEVYTEYAQSWTAAYTLTERLGGYTEWFALFPHSAQTVKPEHYFNGGLTRLFSDNVQFDIRAGVGLNDAAEDFFAGTGLSIRLP